MKFEVFLSIGLSGCKISDELEIADDELEGMTDEQIDEYVEPLAREQIFQRVDWGFSKAR